LSTFADSSALVKLYADEEGHDQIRALAAVAVAQLCRVEVVAAFWRKQRMGELDAPAAQLLTGEFEADYYGTDDEEPRFSVVGTTVAILDEAARLCATHGLRACDAVHLSSALATRDADPTCTTMAVFDSSLRAAAAAEGFTLVPANQA
jgi:predicted nucleic acid-binding protein